MMPAGGTFEARSLWKAPRPLNVPLTCSDSSLSASEEPRPSEPAGNSITGVRRTCGRMRLTAASTSLRPMMISSWGSEAAGRDVAQVVVEVRRGGARVLGGLVVAAQADGPGVIGIGAELLDLVSRHQPALQLQAAHRIGRELAEVIGLDGAEIALGRDMQADRLADFRSEALGQPFGAELIVHVVDAARGGILAELMDHVADVVQQRGEHRGGR